MLPKGIARKVTIYLNQDTRAHVEPLWSTILNFLRSRHVAGATVFWADMGFGSHEQMHNPRSEYAANIGPSALSSSKRWGGSRNCCRRFMTW